LHILIKIKNLLILEYLKHIKKIKFIFKCIAFILTCIGLYSSYLTIFDNTNKEVESNITKNVNQLEKHIEILNENSELNTKNNIQESNDSLEENLKKHINHKLNNKENLIKIISFYESGKKDDLYKMVEYSFKTNKISNEDEVHGYVIAAYTGTKNFKQAAVEILKRDKLRSIKDLSLKEDLAHVLRNYYILNGLYDTVNLIESLKKEYGNKIISYFWALTPIEMMRNLRDDIHYLNFEDVNTKEIKSMIQKFPNDKYIDYAYYMLEDYDKALEVRPSSDIKDILLYSSAYKVIKLIEENIFNINNDLKEKNKISPIEINKAINNFKKYIELFPKNRQADDAAFWISYLYLYKEDISKSLYWLAKIEEYGNKDFLDKKDYHTLDLLNLKNKKFQINYMDSSNDECIKTTIFKNIVPEMKSTDLEKFIKSEKFDMTLYNVGIVYLLRKYIEEFELKKIEKLMSDLEYDNFYDKLEDKCDYYGHKDFFINLKKQLTLISEAREKNTFTEYAKTAILLRKKFHYSLSKVFLDESISKFSNNLNVDYLLYLRILALRDNDFLIRSNKYDYLNLLDKYTNEFLNKMPDSNYADDILAEKMYIELIIYNNLPKAKKTLEYLFKNYNHSVFFSKGNALDNALNWLAYYHLNNCDSFFSDDKNYLEAECLESKKIYTEIKEKFPYTRFNDYANENLEYIEKRIKYIKSNEFNKYNDEDLLYDIPSIKL
jgi:outer membrane protein assembly factor BamD (BamD/ComL family)